MSQRPIRVSPYLFAAHLTSSEVHSDFQIWCPRAVRCTWTKWQWKLVHSPYQHAPASCLRKKNTGLPVLVMNSQLLFADSLSRRHCLIGWVTIRVSPYLSWILNFCSLTLSRRHCLIGWVTIRVSPSILTLTFDWCWIWYRTFNILRWWCRRCKSRQAWQWRHRR